VLKSENFLADEKLNSTRKIKFHSSYSPEKYFLMPDKWKCLNSVIHFYLFVPYSRMNKIKGDFENFWVLFS